MSQQVICLTEGVKVPDSYQDMKTLAIATQVHISSFRALLRLRNPRVSLFQTQKAFVNFYVEVVCTDLTLTLPESLSQKVPLLGSWQPICIVG